MSKETNLRIGVVGNGNRGIIAKLAMELDGNVEVVASVDPFPGARARAVERFGDKVLATDSLDEFIDAGLDAAFITSPDHLHAEQASALLEAGVAVFVDKPLATTLDDADRVLATAFRTGTRLYVGHNMRHMPVFRLMRRLIAEGRIGEVKAVWCRYFVGDGGERFFKDWHADRSKVNSLLLQKGAHDIDIIHWLAGGYSRRVSAMGDLTVYGQITDRTDRTGQMVSEWLDREANWPPLSLKGLNPVVDVEDLSMMTMALDNGVYATYAECHFTPDYWRSYTVIGTEGRIENFGLAAGGDVRLWNRRAVYKPEGDEVFPIPHADGMHNGADPALLVEFLNFVRHGGRTETSPVAGREAVAAASTATDSLRGSSSALPVPALPADLVQYFDQGQTKA